LKPTINNRPLPARILYFHNDLNGAPEELTDSNGEIIWHTRYRVFGKTYPLEAVKGLGKNTEKSIGYVLKTLGHS